MIDKRRIWLVLLGILCSSPVLANIRHEVTSGMTWFSLQATDDHYTLDGNPLSGTSDHADKDYFSLQETYTFFLAPVADNHEIPISLRRFYAHPSSVSVNLALEPERTAHAESLRSAAQFWSHTSQDERSRIASVKIEYYVWQPTGLIFYLNSVKHEQEYWTLDADATSISGRKDRIERSWGIGISHYIFPSLNIRAMFTGSDAEAASTERSWREDRPIFFRDYREDADIDGKRLSFVGEYLFRKRLGWRSEYEWRTESAHTKTSGASHNTIPDPDSYYDDTANSKMFKTTVSVYLNERLTLHAGGKYGHRDQKTTFQSGQMRMTYDGDIQALGVGVEYYITRHLGVSCEYELTKQQGDIAIAYPNTEDAPRTHHERESDLSAVYVGVIGRF